MDKIKAFLSKLHKTGFFSIFVSTVLVKVIAFCQSLFVVRLLSKTEYGLFAYCNNLMGMIMILDGLGCISGILQFGSESFGKPAKRDAYFIFGCKLGIITNLITSMVVVIYALTANFEIEGAKEILLIMCCHPFINMIYNLLSINLRVNFDNNKYSILNVIYVVLTAVGVVIAAWQWKVKGIAWAIYVIVGLTIIIAFVFNKKYLSEIRARGTLDRQEKKAFLKHSLFTAFANASSQLMFMLDMFVIGLVIADELVLADYKVASSIPSALYFIPQAVMIYFYPYFVTKKDDKQWVKKTVPLVYICLLVIALIVGLILIAIAPWLISLIFGEQYVTAVPVFRVLTISFMVGCAVKVISYNLLAAFRKTTFNFVFSIFEGLLNIGLNYWLVVSYGSIGAAIATLAVTTFASLGHFIYLMYVIKKHYKSNDGNNDNNQLTIEDSPKDESINDTALSKD